VSAAKNELLNAAAFAARASGYLEIEAARIYRAYEAELAAAGALDFDDLLMRTVSLLQDVPPVLEHYRSAGATSSSTSTRTPTTPVPDGVTPGRNTPQPDGCGR